jgi:hypothetical protein
MAIWGAGKGPAGVSRDSPGIMEIHKIIIDRDSELLYLNQNADAMKTFSEIILSVVFLFFCALGIQSQTSAVRLDQVQLMQQVLGPWRMDVNTDTVELWEPAAYDKAFVINVYQVIKGVKTPLYFNNIGYDETDHKFKAFALWPDGSYLTWIGAFTTEKKLSIDVVQHFNPEQIAFKLELIFESPTKMEFVYYTKSGEKTWVSHFYKVQ